MPRLLKKCKDCGAYTMLGPPCKKCGSNKVMSVYPPKFSIEDKYGKYRREMKKRLNLS
ncbi:MAG: nucleolar RNA-binding Nop10p family protein [Promethearchaeota archaeon]